ncbi:hypothetical protein CLPU_1c02430 [Gottschalkia purinilytica]|uniref:GAF domain-containing protein n=1 Tax=Gottschalkia purinilytica TaxID=1503 RepID=A0A0L0WF17_GOTPU|nr:hypothetical protein [Gottschalkia purinilytica]KNF10078.1 hypothetical protein CLPU_1c02430 [Gottschalkia purinilytica]
MEKINTRDLEKLFEQLEEITTVKDIACHKVEEGKIYPIYKTQTKKLSNEEWKSKHSEFKVKVEGDYVLERVVGEGELFYINNVREYKNSSKEFLFFNIESILLIPIKDKSKEVKYTVVLASIGELKEFTAQEIEKCCSAINKFLDVHTSGRLSARGI